MEVEGLECPVDAAGERRFGGWEVSGSSERVSGGAVV